MHIARRSLRRALVTAAILACLLASRRSEAQTLMGSPSSLARQNKEAKLHAFTYLRDREDVEVFVRHGLLVPVRGNADYRLAGVSFPYARPEVKQFVERLSRQYRAACGEPLIVTSLTRPKSNQPRNASIHSVHPTGMALDLRMSGRRSCRSFLERTLLDLEEREVVEATREHRPAHYHVSVFPEPYERYVIAKTGEAPEATRTAASLEETAEAAAETVVAKVEFTPPARRTTTTYRVKSGDTLWRIAQRYGTSVAELRRTNGLRAGLLKRGQVIRVPGRAAEPARVRIASAPARATRHAASSASRAKTYRVKSGDTLWQIAQRNGTTVAALRSANVSTARLRAGQVLSIPGARGAVSSRSRGTAHAKTYRVGRGDSLWEIAKRHGTTVASIRRANNIRSSRLKPGQVISIPAAR